MNEDYVDPTLITFRTASLSGIASDILLLTADMLYTPVSAISIPKGLQLKIWGIRVSGTQITVAVNFCKTYSGITVSSTPHDVIAFDPTYNNPLYLEKNKPIIIPGLAGGETLNVTYTQSDVQAESFVEIDAELSKTNDY